MRQYPHIEGCTEKEVKLLCDLTVAIDQAMRVTITESGFTVVQISILHAALGAVLQKTFTLVPEDADRAIYLTRFVEKLCSQIGKMMINDENMPKGETLQ